MKTVFENLELVKNNETKRFELTYEGATAFIDFSDNSLPILLVWLLSPLRQGVCPQTLYAFGCTDA